MANSCQRRIDTRHGRGAGKVRALDHKHLDTKLPRCLDFRIGRCAAGVFGDDDCDPVFAHEVDFVRQGKGPARSDVTGIRHCQLRLDRIDAADKIMVLRRGLEGQQFLATESEESVGAVCTERFHSAFDICHVLPVIAELFFPSRALQRHKRNIGQFRCFNSVRRYPRRVWVGRIHQKIELVFSYKGGQSAGTTKATGSHRYGLLYRIAGSASHGQKQPVAGAFRQFSGQNTGIRRAAEYEYGACHGL